MIFVHPGSRIPDTGSKNSNKREGWPKICCPSLFCSHKYHKIKNYFIFEQVMNFGNLKRIIELFTQKMSLSSQKYGFGIRIHPRSGKKPIPDPKFRGQEGTGSRSGSATLISLRIHEILVRVRIRGWCGSVPMTNGSGSGSLFSLVTFKMSTKISSFSNFFCLLLFEGTFKSFLKIKIRKKSQNSGNQCFSYYFLLMIEGSGSVSLTNVFGSGRPKNIWILRILIRRPQHRLLQFIRACT